jgi:hypothetical protein
LNARSTHNGNLNPNEKGIRGGKENPSWVAKTDSSVVKTSHLETFSKKKANQKPKRGTNAGEKRQEGCRVCECKETRIKMAQKKEKYIYSKLFNFLMVFV